MNKRTLMLSAAAAALLTAPALADTTIDTVQTTAITTSADGNITISAAGGSTFKSATVPMLEIDSSNTVTSSGGFSAPSQDMETAFQIDATQNAIGSLTSLGSIDLSGSGTDKHIFHLSGVGSFTGSVLIGTAGTTMNVAGDGSIAYLTDAGSVLNGDLILDGTSNLVATTANSSANSAITMLDIAGTLNGNLVTNSGSSFISIGNGAQGFDIFGPIQACNTTAVPTCTEIGSFVNSGSIIAAGVSTRSLTAANAESGSALVIGAGIAGGFENNGPTNSADTTIAASISSNGTAAAPTILIAPELGTPLIIGEDSDDLTNGTFSFVNRGAITAAPEDANINAEAMFIGGSSGAPVVLTSDTSNASLGGLFNSGSITSTAISTTIGTSVTSTAINISNYVTIPRFEVSAQAGSGAGFANITSSISGPQGGTATAILISGTTGVSVPNITVDAGARLIASATVPDPSATTISSLSSIVIDDLSGSVTTINNAGTISATSSPLTNGLTSSEIAFYGRVNTTGITFTNTGTVQGDVYFGSGGDTYTLNGTAAQVATHTGNIDFGLSLGGSHDTLNIGTLSSVTGTITAEGDLDVNIAQTGSLNVQNVGTSLSTRTITVAGGTAPSVGSLNITVSEGLGTTAVVTASQDVMFGPGANLGITYGSFIPTGGTFNLISAPTGHLDIQPADIARYNAEAGGTGGVLPFLFQSASVIKTTVGTNDVLQLSVAPKTLTQLGLKGYAAQMFTATTTPTGASATTVLAGDDALGAALIAGINSQSDAQAAFDAFAPDVSGGARAIAISLTDQSTGVVSARQRQLRLFAKEPGELTLWGNEYGEYLSTHGGTVDAAPVTGFKDHGFGFSLGLDSGSPAGGWYGGAFTFYTGDINETGDRIARTNSLWYMLTGYSTWRGRGLFVDTQATVGYADFKGKRFIELTLPSSQALFTREADSKRGGVVGALGVTVGAALKYGATTITPQISLDGTTLRQEGFTETGGGNGFNLTVAPYYANSLRAFLGSEIREDINLGDFFIQPSARIGYRFDFLNDPAKLRAEFADINSTLNGNQPGSQFTIQGPDPSRGNVVAGANLNATTENWTIGLSFDFVRGTHNATEQVGTLSLLGRI